MKKILLAIFIVLVLVGCQSQEQLTEENTKENKLLATVNGENIFQSDVDDVKTMLAQSGSQINDSMALEQVILQKLLVQEAKEEGINFSAEQVEQNINETLQQQGLTLQSYKQSVGKENYQDVIEKQKEQLMIQKLIDSKVNITDESARDFFEQNKEALTQGNESITYEQVADQVKTYMKQQISQQVLMNLTQQLKEQADITYH